jgi:hypothetical protein
MRKKRLHGSRFFDVPDSRIAVLGVIPGRFAVWVMPGGVGLVRG